jgi:hypothetical protein
MQRNNSADRTIVAGYPGDNPPTQRMGVSNMYIFPVLIVAFDIVAWVVTPLVLLFCLTR